MMQTECKTNTDENEVVGEENKIKTENVLNLPGW